MADESKKFNMSPNGIFETLKRKLILSVGNIKNKEELYETYTELARNTNNLEEKKTVENILEDITKNIVNGTDKDRINIFHEISNYKLKMQILENFENPHSQTFQELIFSLPDNYDSINIAIKAKNNTLLMGIIEKLNLSSDDPTIPSDLLAQDQYALITNLDRIDKMLTTDEQRMMLLEKLSQSRNYQERMGQIILKLSSPENQVKSLDFLEEPSTNLIYHFSNEAKIKSLDKLTERDRANIIATLPEEYDSQKIEWLNNIADESAKCRIISTLKQTEDKFKLLNTLTELDLREVILKGIPSEEISSFIKTDSQRDDIDTLLKYSSFDNEILSIIGERNSLDSKQKNLVKELYEKNNDLLKTINYDLLDKKYVGLESKLPILTCYEDIQEKICSLEDNSLQIFLKSLENYEKDNKNWIDFTSKVITNLSGQEYAQLVENIENVQLSQAQISDIGNILTKKNMFEITTLEQVENFETIKQTVCDSIISGENPDELSKYPKIMEMSENDRIKFAVLNKVYGQYLEEAQSIAYMYAEDIDNLEVNDKNQEYIDYVKSLKIILETDDMELLKDIYSKNEFAQDSSIYDITKIEDELKDTYLDTYNKKLYVPHKEDLVDTLLVDGKEISVYDAGTNFSISLTSIGAYHKNNENTDYKEDWNRPLIASQGYCASYIRNDMLGTAPIHNVVYGFTQYDKGSLMGSGPSDLSSNAAKFKAVFGKKSRFLTEDTMINETDAKLHFPNGLYNEMLMKRTNADGSRKQPSYVVYIKTGNEEQDAIIFENSKKAASSFGIPIVMVDKEKCAKAEMEKISTMVDDYAKQSTPSKLIEIARKFHNNYKGHFNHFDNEAWKRLWNEKGITGIPDYPHLILNENKNRTKAEMQTEQLKEIYEETSYEERVNAMSELGKRANLIMKTHSMNKPDTQKEEPNDAR